MRSGGEHASSEGHIWEEITSHQKLLEALVVARRHIFLELTANELIYSTEKRAFNCSCRFKIVGGQIPVGILKMQ